VENREGVKPSCTVLQTMPLVGEPARDERRDDFERAEGLAPSFSVWKTGVLLLDDARVVGFDEWDEDLVLLAPSAH
jgi:hypothetical protein